MLRKKINSLKKMHAEQGTRATLVNILNRNKNKRIDIFKTFDYVSYKPFGEVYSPAGENARTINWVVPDFQIGGGGHLNILSLIHIYYGQESIQQY